MIFMMKIWRAEVLELLHAAVEPASRPGCRRSGLKASFESDTNMVLIPSIRKSFDFSKLRDDLNTVATVFDDQTQQTTDRLARAILYDLTELENAARLKKGEDPTRTRPSSSGPIPHSSVRK